MRRSLNIDLDVQPASDGFLSLHAQNTGVTLSGSAASVFSGMRLMNKPRYVNSMLKYVILGNASFFATFIHPNKHMVMYEGWIGAIYYLLNMWL